MVRAEIRGTEGGASAPDYIEVHRTYETAIGRLMHAFLGSSSKKVVDLVKTADDGELATYEDWPAVQYEPFVKPTRLYFRHHASDRKDRTPPLSVTPTLEITTHRPPAVLKVEDPTGTVPLPLGIEIPLWAERNMKVTVQAPVDPEIELISITPTESAENLSLNNYIDSYLSSIERELDEGGDFSGNAAQLRSTFEREYEQFVLGAGRIEAEVENPQRVVEPGEPQEFEVSLRPETAGEMMMVFAARSVESGNILSISEMLPLRWEVGDEPNRASDFESQLDWVVVDDLSALQREADWKIVRDVERVRASESTAPAPLEREAGA